MTFQAKRRIGNFGAPFVFCKMETTATFMRLARKG
jgi:hypothetical protein